MQVTCPAIPPPVVCPSPVVCPDPIVCKDPICPVCDPLPPNCPLPSLPVKGVIAIDGSNLGELSQVEPCSVISQVDAPTFNIVDSTLALSLNASGLLQGDTVLAQINADAGLSTAPFRSAKLYFWCVTGSTVIAPSSLFDPSIPGDPQ